MAGPVFSVRLAEEARPRKNKLATDFPSRMSNLAADDEAEAMFDRSWFVCSTCVTVSFQ